MSEQRDLLAIYGAYPRHEGRRKALLEIERALKRLQAGELGLVMTYEEAFLGLMKATMLYSRSRDGKDPQFTPHPATWFHQGRYGDDAAMWALSGQNALKGQELQRHNLAVNAAVKERWRKRLALGQ